MALATVGLGIEFIKSTKDLFVHDKSFYFFSGFIIYFILELVTKVGRQSWLGTFEHELTHAIFMLLCGHRIKEFKVFLTPRSDQRLGFVRSDQKPNWIVYLSPYFFPTIVFLLILIHSFLYSFQAAMLILLIGFFTAFHVFSTCHETHMGQTDLQAAGYLYSFLVLPGLNLYVYIIVLNYVMERKIMFPSLFSYAEHATDTILKLI